MDKINTFDVRKKRKKIMPLGKNNRVKLSEQLQCHFCDLHVQKHLNANNDGNVAHFTSLLSR